LEYLDFILLESCRRAFESKRISTDEDDRSLRDLKNPICGSHQFFSGELLDYLFAQPIFTVPNLINQTKVKASKATLLLAVQKLEKAGLVTKISEGRGRRPTVWKFGALVDLIQD